MHRATHTATNSVRLKPFVTGVAVLWTLVVVISLSWNIYQTRRGILSVARSQARVAYEKDVIYRRWNAQHGGVFVPATASSPANPYLEPSIREITTDSGNLLVRINPAYMTRQVHELGAEASGVVGHITSLNPIRPANAADPWETTALQAFQQGEPEVSSIETMNSQPYLRLMRPLVTEKGCIKCHGSQGYRVGDIRGGISVAIPMVPFQAIQRRQEVGLSLGHGLLWLIGVLGLVFGSHRLNQQINDGLQIQESLRRNEKLLQSVFRVAPIGIGLVKKRVFSMTNERLRGMTGYSNAEMIGRTARMLYPTQEDFEFVGREKYAQIAQHGTGSVETRWQNKTGEISDILLSSTPLNPGDTESEVVFTALDISDRMIALAQLTEEKEKFRILVEESPLGISFIGEDDQYKYCNPAFIATFGDNPQTLPPATQWLQKSPGRSGDSSAIISNLPPQSEAYRNSLGAAPQITNIRDNRGEEKTIQFRAVMMKNGDQILVCEDITEAKALETKLWQAQKMEAIGTLAGGIAHDFNNLLMGIQGRASLLLMDFGPSDPQYEHIKGIEEYVRSATHLTKQLLGFARGGKYEVHPIDINELITTSTAMFGRTRKEIMIRTTLEEQLAAVEADRGQLEQVFLNMYVNAWQAMPNGGVLNIATRNVELDRQACQPHQLLPGRYVNISLADTGFGMDDDTRVRIFDPFFTTKGKKRGTGLGLASAYGIVKNHDGIITVSSNPGHGTTMNVFLPASQRAIRNRTSPEATVQKGSETVLLVDDETMILEVGRAMLQRLGYQVLTAGGGEDALAIFTDPESRIDLVILDLIMPEMSGEEAFDRFRKLKPQLPILLSSGYALDGKAAGLIRKGADGFLQKPFNLTALSKQIRLVLDP